MQPDRAPLDRDASIRQLVKLGWATAMGLGQLEAAQRQLEEHLEEALGRDDYLTGIVRLGLSALLLRSEFAECGWCPCELADEGLLRAHDHFLLDQKRVLVDCLADRSDAEVSEELAQAKAEMSKP